MIYIKCCHKCTERHHNCHSHCERYKDERAAGNGIPNDGVVDGYIRTKHNRIAHELYRGKKRELFLERSELFAKWIF